ncbi:hypothetical protein INT45_010276 [Circinella minor]|uniref:Uncharacterized protein n=1 Tax=Circinella minor TaxID=1195481 RepID=A0A8H7V4I6_9FUNG|nr:hypothetical protein INT45_010276 [Circinella minor]
MLLNQFSIPGTQRTLTNHNSDDKSSSDRAVSSRISRQGSFMSIIRSMSYMSTDGEMDGAESDTSQVNQTQLIQSINEQSSKDTPFPSQASLPYTIAENPHFQAVLSMAQIAPSLAHVKLPSDSTIPIDILRVYRSYEDRIRKLFVDIPSFLYTVDAWTSEWRVPFLGITAHWIDESWKQNSIVLGLELLEGSHTGVNMAAAFIYVLEHWNLQEKPFFLTADNASNMKTMATELELELGSNVFDSKENRIPFIAHIINLAA